MAQQTGHPNAISMIAQSNGPTPSTHGNGTRCDQADFTVGCCLPTAAAGSPGCSSDKTPIFRACGASSLMGSPTSAPASRLAGGSSKSNPLNGHDFGFGAAAKAQDGGRRRGQLRQPMLAHHAGFDAGSRHCAWHASGRLPAVKSRSQPHGASEVGAVMDQDASIPDLPTTRTLETMT